MSEETPTTEPRAFVVSCCDGEKAQIAFARTRGEARNHGPDCGWCQWIDRRVVRAPQYDGGRPTQRKLVVDGWWFNCVGPGCLVERIDEDAFVEGTAVEDEHGDVFCSAACRQKAREAMDKRLADLEQQAKP